MKPFSFANSLFLFLPLWMALQSPAICQPVVPADGLIVIDPAKIPQKPAPVVDLSASAVWEATNSLLTGKIRVTAEVRQGQPKKISLGLSGNIPVKSVTAEGLLSFSENRRPDGDRSLEIYFSDGSLKIGEQRAFEILLEMPVILPLGNLNLPLAGPGENSGGFSGRTFLKNTSVGEWSVNESAGLLRGDVESGLEFLSSGEGSLWAGLRAPATISPDVVLKNVRMMATLAESGDQLRVSVEAEAVVTAPESRLRLIEGNVALVPPVGGPGWQPALSGPPGKEGALPVDLVFASTGTFPVRLAFDAAVEKNSLGSAVNFVFPNALTAEVLLLGFPNGIEFLESPLVVTTAEDRSPVAWLPASGRFDLRWRGSSDSVGEENGELFVNSQARTDITVSPQGLEQSTEFQMRVLQGRLESIEFLLEGDGEIIGVQGRNLSAWSVISRDGKRILQVELSRPVTDQGNYTVTSQTQTGEFPVEVVPLCISPQPGQTRHSGIVRVSTKGAVRFDPLRISGLMQLSPGQWTGQKLQSPQQTVYRFPLEKYELRLGLRQVIPEVAVNQVVLYELGITDRILSLRAELDIREAPLRELLLEIPADYAVASVSGTEVADSQAGPEQDSRRPLRIVFAKPLQGAAVLNLRLEKNEPPSSGTWNLPEVHFPAAKSVRGFVGAVAAPGFRLSTGEINGLNETPLNFFPEQPRGLQLAFRQRSPDWNAALTVDAVGQNIAADLFHLYSLKEGVAFGSVLLNFFVVGAPASEWKFEIPEDAGNLVIDGQEIRSWNREGNTVTVTLNRPLLGAATLLATFEHPLNTEGGRLALGGTRPLGASFERGYVQIVSPLQVRAVTKASENLLKMEASELPAEFRLLTTAPSIAAFQYTNRPFSLDLEVQWFPQADSIEQVVDFAKLETRVSGDGQVVTDARYFVQTRGVGALRLRLPDSAQLWEARIDSVAVTPWAEGDTTVVPLPASATPESASEVHLRFGSTTWFPWRIRLAAPTIAAPVLLTEWTAIPDAGRLLIAGSSASVSPSGVRRQTGFEWLSSGIPFTGFLVLLGVLLAGVFLVSWREKGFWLRVFATFWTTGAVGLCLLGMLAASTQAGLNSGNLDLIAPLSSEGQPVQLTIWNLPLGISMLSPIGVCMILAGLFFLVGTRLGFFGRSQVVAILGWLGISAGLLMQHGGAVWFFGWLAVSLLATLALPLARSWWQSSGRVVAGMLLLFSCSFLQAEPPGGGIPSLQNLEIDLKISGRVAEATATISGVAREGDAFPLLNAPGIVSNFESEGMRLRKISGASGKDSHAFFAVVESDGAFAAKFKFRFPAPDLPASVSLPTAPAVATKVRIEIPGDGWSFSAQNATGVRQVNSENNGVSSAELLLSPAQIQAIEIRPKSRDASTENLVFFVESQQLYLPHPGVVEGIHDFNFQISTGTLRNLVFEIPQGMIIGGVEGEVFAGQPADWRFDPEAGLLRVALPADFQESLTLRITSQLSSGSFPVDLTLEPLRVAGAESEGGMIALAFPEDARADWLKPSGMAALDFEDFPSGQFFSTARDADQRLFRVFRFGKQPAKMDLRVGSVTPEIRVRSAQLLSIGSERNLLAVDLAVDIRRAGVFQLAVKIPEGFEVESVSGKALSHWSETGDAGNRNIVLHLKERTSGEQTFRLTLTSPPTQPSEKWNVPRVLLEGSQRFEGMLRIVPETGLRVQTVEREGVSPMELRNSEEGSPGALGFRLLQADWSLVVSLEQLEPWITAQMLQETRLREGQIRHTVLLRYLVEHSAVKALRVSLPGLDPEAAGTVRAEGEAVAEMVPVGGDVWEIRFRRGVIGEIPIQIEFQERATESTGSFEVRQLFPLGVRQLSAFIALRSSGRLELSPAPLPEGWQKVDWSAVPRPLRLAQEAEMPDFVFRAGDAKATLAVNFRRQELAESLKIRVSGGEFATVFSPRGDSATAARLQVHLNEKTSMAIRLPETADLFNVTVNGEEMVVVRDGAQIVFFVLPAQDQQIPAVVEFAYAVPGGTSAKRKIQIMAPGFNVPLENVTWKVLLPEGWRMASFAGPMNLRPEKTTRTFNLENYLDLSKSRRIEKTESTNELLSKAGEYLREGDQQQARIVLNQAAKTKGVDEATNEDARVQLRNLANQQAIVGLNTRRQKLYLDNHSLDEAVVNEEIRLAARANPVLQGNVQFAPDQLEQILQGNTLEEASSLRRLAERIVAQQLATETAPRPVILTVPERGTEVHFERSIQVDGERPLSLVLHIEPNRSSSPGSALLILVLLGGLGFAFANVAGKSSLPPRRP